MNAYNLFGLERIDFGHTMRCWKEVVLALTIGHVANDGIKA